MAHGCPSPPRMWGSAQGGLPCSLAQLLRDLCAWGEAEGCELGGGRCWALGAPHSCSLGRVRPWLLSPCCSCSITCWSWSLRAGQGLSPTPSCLEEGGGRRAGGLHRLSHNGGHAGTRHVLTCPLLVSLCQQGHPLELGKGGHPSRAGPWLSVQLWAVPAAAPARPCPPGRAARQAGTATPWWGIKGRKGRRKKNTPRHHQLTELAPGWGRVGTAAGLVCQLGTGEGLQRAVKGGHPFCAPVTHPYSQGKPGGATYSTMGATPTLLLVPRLTRIPSLSLSPQVNDFLSGRSPLTLALRVGDHMMFVQLQLAAQQSTGQLQHRHLIASRGEAGAGASPHCRTLHGAGGSGFARIPVVPSCQQSPAPSPTPTPPTPPVYCNAPHAAPVTAGMFRSHGASTQTVNSSVVSSCSEVRLGGCPGAFGKGE